MNWDRHTEHVYAFKPGQKGKEIIILQYNFLYEIENPALQLPISMYIIDIQ